MDLFERLSSIAAKFQGARLAEIVARKGDEASLYIYDAITPDSVGGVSAKKVVAALAQAQGAKTLHVRINSIGGAVQEAKAIYQQLKEHPARKVVHVDGLAASAASFVAMVGDEIVSSAEATWFIHGAQGMTMGDAADHRTAADMLDAESQHLADVYAARTGQPMADVRKWMDAETFMDAPTARARRFTDRIEGEEPTATRAVAALSADTKFRIAQATAAAVRITRDRASPAASPGQPGNSK